MTFMELLKTVVFDDVWTELEKEYSMIDEAFEAYFKVFNQLKSLMPEPNHYGMRLAVARIEDGLEPGTYTYDVFGIKPGDNEHYALELLPWSELLSFEVIEKCVEAYSAAVVVAHSLYELTFLGYDAADVEANIKNEINILKERSKEIENGTAEFVSWDEVCKDIGYVDERTEEEKELQNKQFERINAENKKVYEMLLS
ncbi:MAG: hypothetical protein A4E52_01649 [Pelotomaculum sp. PtaB.Bin013]|uniref:Uncharacterized protein n=2 Tax=Pelotomaculum TaxID=191373 RepID=A0A9X4JVP6_9FIRM|nr:DUF6557 family protein [Pelotomaculum isophthalicicum]MDF9407783.1 hypothetical protein [Pelotomaculum isophthalicicum JI]OPX85412.1 MAG: hypothetical protein A4E52_01649 [Pelotomaculum sp. PtaB.Bin013]